jgi:Tfp pilus assembly protein PilN
MRALHLDFLHPAGPRLEAGPVLLALGIAAAVLVGWRFVALGSDVEDLEARLADVKRLERRELPRIRLAGTDQKVLAQEVGRANAVLASLTLPWDAMFGELESAAHANVGLLAIQPEASGRQVRLAGEARTFEELLAYIARLEATAGFGNVLLATHELKPGGASRPVAFTLTADWVGRR